MKKTNKRLNKKRNVDKYAEKKQHNQKAPNSKDKRLQHY